MDMNNPLWQLLWGAVLIGISVVGSYFGLRVPAKGSPQDALLDKAVPSPGPAGQPFPWAMLVLVAGVAVLVFARSKMRAA